MKKNELKDLIRESLKEVLKENKNLKSSILSESMFNVNMGIVCPQSIGLMTTHPGKSFTFSDLKEEKKVKKCTCGVELDSTGKCPECSKKIIKRKSVKENIEDDFKPGDSVEWTLRGGENMSGNIAKIERGVYFIDVDGRTFRITDPEMAKMKKLKTDEESAELDFDDIDKLHIYEINSTEKANLITKLNDLMEKLDSLIFNCKQEIKSVSSGKYDNDSADLEDLNCWIKYYSTGLDKLYDNIN